MCCLVVTRFLSGVRTVKIRASCRGERHRVATESSLFLLLLVVWLMLVVVFRRRLSKWACWLSFALPALAAWRLFFGGRYFVLCACATGVAAVAAVAYPSFTPTKSCFDSRVLSLFLARPAWRATFERAFCVRGCFGLPPPRREM